MKKKQKRHVGKPKRKKLGYKTIAKRITGITVGPFGVSWTPSQDTRKIIRGLLVFLEDRRVLFAPYHMEYGPWVMQSVLEIRKELTKLLKNIPEDDPTSDVLRTMRGACRKFLQEYDNPKPKLIGFPYEMKLAFDLGEFRGIFGLAIARLCVAYKTNVEPHLAEIFPLSDEE